MGFVPFKQSWDLVLDPTRLFNLCSELDFVLRMNCLPPSSYVKPWEFPLPPKIEPRADPAIFVMKGVRFPVPGTESCWRLATSHLEPLVVWDISNTEKIRYSASRILWKNDVIFISFVLLRPKWGGSPPSTDLSFVCEDMSQNKIGSTVVFFTICFAAYFHKSMRHVRLSAIKFQKWIFFFRKEAVHSQCHVMYLVCHLWVIISA